MPIVVTLDVMMAKRKVSLNQLSEMVGISTTNLSLMKTGKVRGVRFATLDGICRALACEPGDILAFRDDGGDKNRND